MNRSFREPVLERRRVELDSHLVHAGFMGLPLRVVNTLSFNRLAPTLAERIESLIDLDAILVQSVAAIGNKLQQDEQIAAGRRELRPEAGSCEGFGLPEFDPEPQETLRKRNGRPRCTAGRCFLGRFPKWDGGS